MSEPTAMSEAALCPVCEGSECLPGPCRNLPAPEHADDERPPLPPDLAAVVARVNSCLNIAGPSAPFLADALALRDAVERLTAERDKARRLHNRALDDNAALGQALAEARRVAKELAAKCKCGGRGLAKLGVTLPSGIHTVPCVSCGPLRAAHLWLGE